MDKFLEAHNWPKLNHKETENLKTPIMSKEIEWDCILTKQSLGTDVEFYQTHNEELTSILFSNSEPKIEEKGTLPNSFMRLFPDSKAR